LFCVLPYPGMAQAIDNTISYKNISNSSYARLNYENDFFSATDKYYTQGIHLEVASPGLKGFPLTRLLLHPKYKSITYGFGLEHNGYTPTSISNPAILYGDRPFAACLFLKTFLIAIDPDKKQRFSSTCNTGVIGQAAGGMEMQTGIHRWLHNITPHGWPNQIHNDLLLNYEVSYEKQLISYGHFFSLDADANARLGTLSNKAGVGITMMAGYFNSPFDIEIIQAKNFRIYAYEHAKVNLIGYDATLQGGLFNKSSPYTLRPDDIVRYTFQNRFGFVVIYKRIYLEYFQSMLSAEFKTGNYHVWGGVQIALGF
jgi:lipid A 3-O-deacylase